MGTSANVRGRQEEDLGLLFRWLGLWRLVPGRVRSDWPFLLAVWLLIVGATTLLAAGTLYAETVEAGGLRRALAEADAADRGVSVSLSGAPAEVAALDDAVRRTLEGAFAQSGADISLTVRSSTLQPTRDGTNGPAGLFVLGAYEDVERHADLVDGSWPATGSEPIEAALAATAANALGFTVGTRLSLADAASARSDPTVELVGLTVVGIFEPRRESPYWLGDRLEPTGIAGGGSAPLYGPLMVGREDLVDAPGLGRLDLRWRALPIVERMRIDQLEQTRAQINDLPRRVAAAVADGRFVTIERGLADVLGRIDRSSLVSRSGVVLITLQFGILAAYAVLLVGGMLAERRRADVALLRARGASTPEIGLVATGEAAVLTFPAAVLAPLLALVLVEGIGRWDAIGQSGIIAGTGISSATILVALAAGVACVVALTLPSLLAEIDLARVRAALGRPLSQSLAQRLGLDLVLLALAVIGIFQLRTYGATLTQTTAGRLELDPLLVAAPAISLAAGAVLVLRLVPRIGELVDWLARRRRGLVLPLAARQVARRPLRYTRAALLIVLAAALGTFGTMYSATWSRSQVDQATYQTGGDVRVVMPPHSRGSGEERARAMAELPGVSGLTPLARQQFSIGRVVRSAPMLGVEPTTMSPIIDRHANGDGRLAAALAELAATRQEAVGLALPPDSRRLAVIVDSDISFIASPAEPIDPQAWPGLSVTPVVDAGDGVPRRLRPLSAMLAASEQRLIFDLPAPPPDGSEARVIGIEVVVNVPHDAIGTIGIDRLEISPSTGADGWVALASVAELSDWSFYHFAIRDVDNYDLHSSVITGTPGHTLPACLARTFAGCAVDRAVYRWRHTGGEPAPLAALANRTLLEATGSAVGETISVDAFGELRLRIVDVIEAFPSLDPAQPWVIVDVVSLNAFRDRHDMDAAEPNELWLTVADEHLGVVTEAATAPPVSAAQVQTRSDLTLSLQRDPIALGLLGALLLGSLAAAAFAGIGLLVTAIVAAREQMGEFALLRALGASSRQVLAWLSIDHLLLLLLGVLAGSALGALIAHLVLPFAPLNRAGTQVVPSPQVIVPWELLGGVALGAFVVVVVSVWLAHREVACRPIVDVLRERED
jgi:hypothetical protein